MALFLAVYRNRTQSEMMKYGKVVVLRYEDFFLNFIVLLSRTHVKLKITDADFQSRDELVTYFPFN